MKWQTKFSLIDDAETTREKKLQYLEKSVISHKEPFILQIVWAFHREKNGNECWKKRNDRQKRCWAATRRNAKKWRQVFHGHITFLSITRQKTKKERLFFFYFPASFQDSLCLRSDWSCDLLSGKGRKSRMYNFRK